MGVYVSLRTAILKKTFRRLCNRYNNISSEYRPMTTNRPIRRPTNLKSVKSLTSQPTDTFDLKIAVNNCHRPYLHELFDALLFVQYKHSDKVDCVDENVSRSDAFYIVAAVAVYGRRPLRSSLRGVRSTATPRKHLSSCRLVGEAFDD